MSIQTLVSANHDDRLMLYLVDVAGTADSDGEPRQLVLGCTEDTVALWSPERMRLDAFTQDEIGRANSACPAIDVETDVSVERITPLLGTEDTLGEAWCLIAEAFDRVRGAGSVDSSEVAALLDALRASGCHACTTAYTEDTRHGCAAALRVAVMLRAQQRNAGREGSQR
ncbi:MAG: hypothetical protein U0353_27545 [Sandaracinus sp.]